MSNKPIPAPLAMVICDDVIDDRRTGKKSLIGIFSNIYAQKVPCSHARLNVFLSLTEGIGDYDMKVRCVKVGEEKEIMSMGGPIKFANPNQIVEFNFEILGLIFPDYGDYRFEILCNNKPVIARKFIVASGPKKGK